MNDPAIAAYLDGVSIRTITATTGVPASTLYNRLRRLGISPRERTMAGVPVYDEAGELFARSVTEAARKLRAGNVQNLYDRHLADYRDGWRLRSRPRRAREEPAHND